jgi:hypothetical protein
MTDTSFHKFPIHPDDPVRFGPCKRLETGPNKPFKRSRNCADPIDEEG